MNYRTEKKMMVLRNAINEMVTFPECDYRNMVIADAIANGHKDKLTEDWLRKVLLSDVEEGFITFGQALTLQPIYMNAIKELSRMA